MARSGSRILHKHCMNHVPRNAFKALSTHFVHYRTTVKYLRLCSSIHIYNMGKIIIRIKELVQVKIYKLCRFVIGDNSGSNY